MKTTNTTIELTIEQLKYIALLQHLGEDLTTFPVEDLEEIEGNEEKDGYMVLTDNEADEIAKINILDSAWAFTPNFLSSFTGIDIEVFEAIQENGRCESNNSAILSMIEDEDAFVSEAISWDGRGHFMNSYDGREHEEMVNSIRFYIYRMN